MELVPYKLFGKLRLKQFCPKDDLYDEHADEHGVYLIEEIRGAVFARWRKRLNELAIADVDLGDYSTDVASPLFKTIGLNLESGLSPRQVTNRIGSKPKFRSKDRGYVSYHTSGKYRYEVACGFDDDKKLLQVRVRRLDLKIPGED